MKLHNPQGKWQLLFLLLNIYCLSSNGQHFIYEAENGKTNGTVVDSSRSGFSGSGYITGFKNKKDGVNVIINASLAGLYSLSIRYASSYGPQSSCIYVNDDALGSRSFTKSPSFTEIVIGNVLLNAGNNLVRIEKDLNYFDVDWSYFDVDYLVVEAAKPTPAVSVLKTLVTPNSSKEAIRVISYLIDMSGQKIISGQQGNEAELEYIEEHTGKRPAIRGFDLLNYSPSIDWDDGTTENIINWFYESKGIPTVCWHWFSPSGKKGEKSFYRSETDFDFAKAIEEKGEDYILLMRDIDAIAAQLMILKHAGVPVLWRPLHEASSPAFWWGSKGPNSYVTLYKLLFDRLTQHHKLNNLIWVWTTYDDAGAFDWYPGPEYVDIISTDIYLDSNNYHFSSTIYDNLVNRYGGKLVTLSENGIMPDPNKLKKEKAAWSWFCTWSGEFISNGSLNRVDHVKKVYNHDYVITLDELPGFTEQRYTKKNKIWDQIGNTMSYGIILFFLMVLGKVAYSRFKK